MKELGNWQQLSSTGLVKQIWDLFEQLGHVFGPLKDLLGLI